MSSVTRPSRSSRRECPGAHGRVPDVSACATVKPPGSDSKGGDLSGGSESDGLASWYGADFAGKETANGERFNPEALTAAHRTLPFGSCVRVTLQSSGREVDVRINDRGPFIKGRIIDLSARAARELGLSGVEPVALRPCPAAPGPTL